MKKDVGILYDEKRKKIEGMEAILKAAKEGNRDLTQEERNKFDSDNLALDLISDEISQRNHQAMKRAEEIFIEGGGQTGTSTKEESFSNQAGIEIPVYNRRSKNSVREDFLKNNTVDESLRDMSFGRYIRARLFGPKDEQEKRALNESTPSAGGYTVPQIVSAEFIDRLRPISRVLQAGANVFTIDEKTNKYNLAKLLTGPTIQWLAESSESTPSSPTFGNVQFNFRTARAIVRVSNELVQDSLNLERVLQTEAVKGFASEIDRCALVGNGVLEPKGIINYTDHEYVTIGANGAAPTDYDEIIALIYELQANNANVDGSSAAIMHPRTLAAYNVLKGAVELQPLQRPEYIKNMPFLHTTAVPITDTQGSSSVASKLFIGNWSELYFGFRLGVTIIPLNQRYAEFNETAFMIVMRVDVQPYHEESFGYIRGLLGASIPT